MCDPGTGSGRGVTLDTGCLITGARGSGEVTPGGGMTCESRYSVESPWRLWTCEPFKRCKETASNLETMDM